jgi:large subunit ribosomal protein L24
MKIKTGDTIVVISGNDAGKKGKVVRAYPALDKVLVEGVNVKKRHIRARSNGKKGEVIDKPHPIHVSNVRLEAKK